MRRVPRIRTPLGSVCRSQSSPALSSRAQALCKASSTCIQQQQQRNLSTTPIPRQSSSTTDHYRRKLWRDTPPGPEDPYKTSSTSSPPEEDAAQARSIQEDTATELYEEEWQVPQIQTSLKLPSDVVVAPRAEELDGAQYVPAEKMDGLEWVGGLEGWWEDESHWSPSNDFVGFGPREKVRDASLLEVLARRAVVEALAWREAADSESLAALWERGGREELLRALALGVEVAENGAATLKGDVSKVVEDLRWRPAEQETSEAVSRPIASEEFSAEEAREFLKSWDKSWKNVSLQDPRLKFAVTKRILQLTGQVIPDTKLQSIHNVQHLLAFLVKPPQPKKVAEVIESRGDLLNLPNVQVYSRRVTPVDKHKMVGRWKIIVQELEKRGLPATGTGKYDKAREREYLLGKS